MAMLQFNAAEVQPSQHDMIPAGVYEAMVVDSESRPMKSGNGTGINFTFQILSGPLAGRKVFKWITYEHRASEDAQRIGREQLSSLCRAVNVLQLQDTCQLHNLPLTITVGVDRRDPSRSEVTKFAAKRPGAAGAQAPSAAPAQPAPSSATGSAPWAR